MKPTKTVVIFAWIVVLLSSTLPKVILQEIFGMHLSEAQQYYISMAVIAVAFLATLVWKSIRGLWPYLILLAVLVISQWLVFTRLDKLPFFYSRLNDPSFSASLLTEMLLKLLITLVMIGTLLLMGKKRQDFYLVKGDLDAPAEPIRWLGVSPGTHWKRFGTLLTIFISLGTLAFLIIAGRPPLDIIRQALPFLPAVLLAAALNAFNEEMTYKASFLSVLEGPVGKRQALYMVALFFGIGHYYGVPYGIIGVVLATFLGWILAKSMQETHGFFWAWFIHFWQDVWIFSFLAIGSIIPGGG